MEPVYDTQKPTDSLHDLHRIKPTNLQHTLPPIAELIADQNAVLQFTNLDGQTESVDYRALAARDPFRIPMPIDREGYGTVESSRYYWATGYGDWLNVSRAVDRYVAGGARLGARLRLLDFGCSSGRFLRHAWSHGRDSFDIWGCDFAPANVDWAKKYLPGDFKIFLNHNVPHLPFADGYFDVITAFSVFTHIDLFEEAWLLELGRIIRPAGILYVTIQNQATWDRTTQRPTYIARLMGAKEINRNSIHVSEDLFRAPMPQPRIVFRMSAADIYNCNVWHHNEYVRELWARYFEILDIVDNSHNNFQSVAIMRPRDFQSAFGAIESSQ
jgi:SAM-dependent methyltransferase